MAIQEYQLAPVARDWNSRPKRRRDKLVVDNINLVWSIAKDMSKHNFNTDLEELVAFGMIGLVEAADRYQDGHGAKFSTYAAIRIRGAIIDELRSYHGLRRRALMKDPEAKRARVVSLFNDSAPLHLDAIIGDGIAVADIVMDKNDAFADRIEDMVWVRRIAALQPYVPREKWYVFEQYYFTGRPMADIATEVGVTDSRISQICREVLDEVRALLGLPNPNTEPEEGETMSNQAATGVRIVTMEEAAAELDIQAEPLSGVFIQMQRHHDLKFSRGDGGVKLYRLDDVGEAWADYCAEYDRRPDRPASPAPADAPVIPIVGGGKASGPTNRQLNVERYAAEKGLVTSRQAMEAVGLNSKNPAAVMTKLAVYGLRKVETYKAAQLFKLDDVMAARDKMNAGKPQSRSGPATARPASRPAAPPPAPEPEAHQPEPEPEPASQEVVLVPPELQLEALSAVRLTLRMTRRSQIFRDLPFETAEAMVHELLQNPD